VRGVAELQARVVRLDRELDDPGSSAVSAASAFARVMSLVTAAVGDRPIPSDVADTVVARSRLLALLGVEAPGVVSGPLMPDAQFWVATGKPPHVPIGNPVPAPDRFDDASTAPFQPGTKPFGLGLFTSTAVADTPGMWWLYLQDHRAAGGLFPYPWRVWALTPQRPIRVYEVTSARRWTELVTAHPLRHGDLVYPDWRSITRRYDGVHMTARAIAATQGLRFRSSVGVVAAPFWDVESTLWLRWCFGAPRLIHSVD
jgi:hypothetical protein